MHLKLWLPHLHHAQRAEDQSQLKAFLSAQVHRHGRFAGAHGGRDHGAASATAVELLDEGHRLALVTPGRGLEPGC